MTNFHPTRFVRVDPPSLPMGQTLYKSRNDQGLKPIDYMKTYCMPQFLSNNEDFADIKNLLMKGTRAVTAGKMNTITE